MSSEIVAVHSGAGLTPTTTSRAGWGGAFSASHLRDESEDEGVRLLARERLLRWIEPVVSVSRFAADRASAVRRLREALDRGLGHPVIREHSVPDLGLDDLEYVVEVVPPDVLAAQYGEHVLKVPVALGAFDPLARLHRRSNEVDDLDATVGTRTFDPRVDFAVHADRRTDVDEVLLRAALIDDYGRRDPRRREAAELDVECAGCESDERPATLLDFIGIRERREVGGAEPEGTVLLDDHE